MCSRSAPCSGPSATNASCWRSRWSDTAAHNARLLYRHLFTMNAEHGMWPPAELDRIRGVIDGDPFYRIGFDGAAYSPPVASPHPIE